MASETARMGAIAVLAVVVLASVAASLAGQKLQQNPASPPSLPAVSDANGHTQAIQQPDATPSTETAEVERKKQIADESAILLKLATELKTEVDKTDKDTLSIEVIRKAAEIEKTASSVREKLKLSLEPK